MSFFATAAQAAPSCKPFSMADFFDWPLNKAHPQPATQFGSNTPNKQPAASHVLKECTLFNSPLSPILKPSMDAIPEKKVASAPRRNLAWSMQQMSEPNFHDEAVDNLIADCHEE